MSTTRRSARRKFSSTAQTHEAVALSYDPQEGAPTVVARGRGRMARQIVEKARENDVAVVSDHVALEALRLVDVGEEIPPKVYHMVAEILAFVYNLGERPKHEP